MVAREVGGCQENLRRMFAACFEFGTRITSLLSGVAEGLEWDQDPPTLLKPAKELALSEVEGMWHPQGPFTTWKGRPPAYCGR